MSFNSQATMMATRGPKFSIFKDQVRYQYLMGKRPFLIRIMPAFDPNNQNAGTSYLPCIDPEGKLTNWGTYIRVARFVGHDNNRKDLLSLKTLETVNAEVWCPLQHLHDTIAQDVSTWGYLTDNGGRDNKTAIRTSLSKIVPMLVMNIMDINAPQNGVQLGICTNNVANQLVRPGSGLVFALNASANIEELIKQSYLYAYANGDITCPNYGLVFTISKGDDRGDFSAYSITIAQDSSRRVIRRTVDQVTMAQRYNLNDYNSFLDIPTEEELVNDLVKIFNRRAPVTGYHEHVLLRQAFPQFGIPEPPAAPAATSTIPAGMAFNQGNFPTSPGANMPGQGVPNIPGAIPPGGYSNPGVPGSAPVPSPMVPGGPVSPAPAIVPGGIAPHAPAIVPGGIAPAAPNNIAAGVPPAVGSGPAYVPAPPVSVPVATPPEQNTGAAPVVPGDSIPTFDPVAFMNKLGMPS